MSGHCAGHVLFLNVDGLHRQSFIQKNTRGFRAYPDASPVDSGWEEGTRCPCSTPGSIWCVCPQFLGYIFTTPPALFSSKEGAAQVRLKVGLETDSIGHNFAFSSPLALTERETFKAQLTTIISNNRAARDTGAVQPPQAGVHAPSSSSNSAIRRAPAPAPSRASDSRAESVSSHRGTPVNDPIHDFHIRKKVLLNTPELAALHRDLVMSGQITETEFWEGREVCDTPTHDTPYFDLGIVATLAGTGRFRLAKEGPTRSAG